MSRRGSPIFVVLDGLDGAGKTTHVQALADVFPRVRPVHITREPSGGPEGRLIWEILEKRVPEPSWQAMALLFAADRMRHCGEEIRPALERGEIVICDRYLPSNLAYQTVGALLQEGWPGRAAMDWINDANMHCIMPSLTILLNAPIDTVMERLEARPSASRTLYEKRSTLERVQSLMFSSVKKSLEGRIHKTIVINTDDKRENVERRVLRAIANHHQELELELRVVGLLTRTE